MMKTKISLLLFIAVLLASCSKWHYGHGPNDDDPDDHVIYEETLVDEGADGEKQKTYVSPNEIIVRYEPEISSTRRAEIRSEFPIVTFRECDCGDTNIELWIFDPDIDEIEIEGVVNRLPSRNPRGKTRGERSFDIQLSEVGPFTPQGQGVIDEKVPLIADAGDAAINIAVIDTGIDFYRYLSTGTPKKFLFPSGNFSDCHDTRSGWNFIGYGVDARMGNPNILDQNGHGTYVTKIITDMLDKENRRYQILPLKVFDSNGKGSYWDVLCALAYVKHINQNGGNLSIVNASFGGAMSREFFEPSPENPQNLFVEVLEELEKQGTLVVTSAGNAGRDNDIGPEGDFMTSFQAGNILSVGGYHYDIRNPDARPVELAPLSNFGSKGSIDVAMAFNNYEIVYDTSDPFVKNRITLQGTSYSSAAMSGFAGAVNERAGGLPPQTLKEVIFELSEQSERLAGKIDGERYIPRE